jgi:hypothetical protein
MGWHIKLFDFLVKLSLNQARSKDVSILEMDLNVRAVLLVLLAQRYYVHFPLHVGVERTLRRA